MRGCRVNITYKGRGVQARARKATSVRAQFVPRFLNMGETNSGNLRTQPRSALPRSERNTDDGASGQDKWGRERSTTHPTPNKDRRTELAASTDAA
jgi:hypothetical protein